MNAIQAFFRKYHAVPANDAGPQWSQASDAALCGWADQDCQLWDTTLAPDGMVLWTRMVEVRNELWARLEAVAAEERRAALRGAWYSICERIGFGGAA